MSNASNHINWQLQNEIREHYRNHFDSVANAIPNARYMAVTLTLRQGMKYADNPFIQILTRNVCSNVANEFVHRLNLRVFKRAYKGADASELGKRLACLCTVERSKFGKKGKPFDPDEGRLHLHMLLQIPDHLSLNQFIKAATKVWTPLRWGLRMKKFELCYDVRGWINYITKDYAKYEECFDHQSTWFPVHQLTQSTQENLKNIVLLNIKEPDVLTLPSASKLGSQRGTPLIRMVVV